MKTCKKCRNSYDDSFKFCPNCGSSKVLSSDDIAKGKAGKEIAESIVKQRKKRQLIMVVTGVIAVIVFIVVIASISSAANKPVAKYDGISQKEFNAENKEYLKDGKENLKDNDYEDAIEELGKVDNQYKGYGEAQNLLEDAVDGYVDEIIDEANNYIDNKQYEKALDVINEAKLSVGDEKSIKKAMDNIIDEFREDYLSRAEELETSGKFEDGIRLLKNVNSIFTDDVIIQNKIYEMTNKYKSEFIDKADEYLENNDYTEAINIFESAILIFGDDTDLNSALINAHVVRVKDEVKSYENSSNFASGIAYLEDQLDDVDNNAEIVQKLNSFKTNYKNELLAEAESKFDTEGYEAAIVVLNQGKKVLGNDSNIIEAIQNYELYAPVRLIDLDYLGANDMYIVNESRLLNSGIEINGYYEPRYSNTRSSIIYMLNGNYSILTGIGGVSHDSREDSDIKSDVCKLAIFGDDKLLFMYGFDNTTLPANFDLDITGIQKIEIKFSKRSTVLLVGNIELWR